MVTLDFAIPLEPVVSGLVAACLGHELTTGAGRLAIRLERNATQDAVLTVSATGAALADERGAAYGVTRRGSVTKFWPQSRVISAKVSSPLKRPR
jgi:hypothetical protein